MALRGLDPGKIANFRDVVEKRFSEMSSWFEASLADRVKEGMVKFRGDLWSWSLPIRKRVV